MIDIGTLRWVLVHLKVQGTMEFELKSTGEVIKVYPKTKYLCSTELTQLRNVNLEFTGVGLKRTEPKNTEEEKLELENLYGAY